MGLIKAQRDMKNKLEEAGVPKLTTAEEYLKGRDCLEKPNTDEPYLVMDKFQNNKMVKIYAITESELTDFAKQENEELIKKNKSEFDKGYSAACANLIFLHGPSTESNETFHQHFNSIKDAKKSGVSDWDIAQFKRASIKNT